MIYNDKHVESCFLGIVSKMTNEELIKYAKAIVEEGDMYGTRAYHSTTIFTRQILEQLALRLETKE